MTDKKPTKKSKSTSWGGVAHWYDTLLARDDTYQARVILPNILRAMAIIKGERVLDLACGQGFFTRAFFQEGADATGVDLGKQLVLIARKESPKEIKYFSHSAENLSLFEDSSFEKIAILLAIQNIEAPHKVFKECARVLKPHGKLFIVLNHPAFRIPKASAWGYDEEAKTQYRRVDSYMSESKVEIEMNPSKRDTKTTISFHRPLQYYFKTLANSGFVVARLEEWLSHRESESGPRKKAEDRARKEIPMFLFLEVLRR
ncbi:MAG: SAM-dependent methyltransferase [Candidatus Yonathbacteria bacterium CG10_big_fil_rev_8_21_14_0_10_43_136]|uniref:SAM-dependent methyltransferase n=1 Tax=Candidatus Yonathbacteria bacterium CG_4_10_14_0_8_um_filter_43_17 TaxID=1975099 RepID=A0A2M7Q4Y1_9BACT|nr:MAG: SAM-dependent methyltransferase [Candidatus Yonathbacteria bacterium CG17_big_fil_post_rev_8_21_14_2_50_43_9]PIR40892.1 MAG: SAM-dependent methyltransferase [Candidatus Yonathbacteria bacterium CG10_big_fil_rev_8_21_14_0_10_43_136]PIX57533.1 MAG: SAM-dependent methyltransferase [Candidatus Yonathbacteria bacterium CG_4_10_14_3_um_filter_43_12]PIY58491.1 MAG: SAM-dependent methyltransferase [Candidatus Yonathbacteria bacterium CG_4_10_14_0_8_um_filter_43_17]PJC21665.1 MAG: SAM-dependent 